MIKCKIKKRRILSVRSGGTAFNRLSANPTKWSNTLKQFVGKVPTNCLSVFDHFVILALKGLRRHREVKVIASTLDLRSYNHSQNI